MSATVLQQTFGALETLAFTLPGAAGPVASALLHIFGSVFDPEEPDPNKAILDAIQNGFNHLQNNSVKTLISESQNYVDDLDNWITNIQGRTDLDSTATLRTIIPDFDDFDKPITTLDPIINKLNVTIESKDSTIKWMPNPQYLPLAKAQLSMLITLRVSIVCLLNFRVLLQERLAVILNDSDQDIDKQEALSALELLSTYYVSLRVAISNMTDTSTIANIRAQCDQIKANVVANVGSVISGGSDPYYFDRTAAKYYFYLDETGTVRDRQVNVYDNSPTPGGVPTFRLLSDKKTAVDASRTKYIVDLQAQVDVFKNEQVSIYEHVQKLAEDTTISPNPPAAKPQVDYDSDTGWLGAWQHTGKFVRYAIGFIGTQALVPPPGSKLLQHSDWHQCIQPSSFCPVITLPNDPNKMAVGRIVYRDVADDTSGTNLITLSIRIPNVTQLALTDLLPVNDDDVCPNVLIPPILWAENYATSQTGKTWPSSYRVRYRYKLQKSIGGKLCTSLDWSPWSAPRPVHGQDIDTEGYYNNQSYYSSQLLIPDPGDSSCTFILQRQFKGQNSVEIASSVSKAKQAGMLFLSDQAGV